MTFTVHYIIIQSLNFKHFYSQKPTQNTPFLNLPYNFKQDALNTIILPWSATTLRN